MRGGPRAAPVLAEGSPDGSRRLESRLSGLEARLEQCIAEVRDGRRAMDAALDILRRTEGRSPRQSRLAPAHRVADHQASAFRAYVHTLKRFGRREHHRQSGTGKQGRSRAGVAHAPRLASPGRTLRLQAARLSSHSTSPTSQSYAHTSPRGGGAADYSRRDGPTPTQVREE